MTRITRVTAAAVWLTGAFLMVGCDTGDGGGDGNSDVSVADSSSADDASTGGGGTGGDGPGDDATVGGGGDEHDVDMGGGGTTDDPDADMGSGGDDDPDTVMGGGGGGGDDADTGMGGGGGGGDDDPDTDMGGGGGDDDPDTEMGGGTDDPPPAGGCLADAFLDLTDAPGAGAGYADAWVTASCTETELLIQSNGMPHYTFVATTPNALVEVPLDLALPIDPELADAPSDIPLLGLVAIAINGAAIYGPNEGAFPDPYGDPIYNGIMDGCLGHTANAYHYHGLDPRCLSADNYVAEPWTTAAPDASEPSPILAFSLDGFPIYGPYGCLDAECAEVVEFTSGWVQTGDPTTYAWDNYEWQESADPTVLDECNGRVGPDGKYRYHATAGFPYVLGCYMGEPVGAGGGGGGDPGGGDPGGGDGPTSCDSDMDCDGACADGYECNCITNPMGDQICVPSCNDEGECPGDFTCNQQNLCVPAGGPSGGGGPGGGGPP